MMFEPALVRTKMMILEQMSDRDESAGSDYLDRKVHDFPKFVIWMCGPEATGFKNLHPDIVKQELIPFARFVVFKGAVETLKEHCDVQSKPPKCISTISNEEESMAGQFLLDSIAEHLSRYPASAAEDDNQLASLSAKAPEKPFLRIRRDEQHCLTSLEAAVKEVFPTLIGK